jgi:hypothetical protein
MTAHHVDIVSNEPLASKPRLLARVILNGGPGLEMDLAPGRTDEQRMWSYLRSRVEVDPDRDPQAFLEALAPAIDSTYVGASEVHDDAHCPFCRDYAEYGSGLRITGPLPG